VQPATAIDISTRAGGVSVMNRPSSSMSGGAGNSPTDDRRLVALLEAIARERSKEAFAELFGLMAPRLKAYVMRAGARPDVAEEIAQEAMIAIWRRADSFDSRKAGAATWIFTIVRNKRIDMLRRQARPELREEDFLHLDTAPAQPDEQICAGEAAALLRSRLTELPREQAQVIEMAYFEDKSHRAIAEELDLPLGTVKSRMRLALARIKHAMAGRKP